MCGVQDQNARDLLMHLHEWHKMLISWYESNVAGQEVAFLPEGFTWKTTPELNEMFHQNYQSVTLDEAKKLVATSHKQVMDIIAKHSDTELFEKSHYGWTGTTSLGQYLVSATVAHYEWATKLLKKM